ncbi:MAG: penicillin-insensitive murein endopeptidase [Bacteroidota bacterium]
MRILFLIFWMIPMLSIAQPSRSFGSVSNGSLQNGQRLAYKGSNYTYFSRLSYHLLRRAHVHHKVKAIVEEAYAVCEKHSPEYKYRVMECSRKHGGKMWPHRTHQNGLSVDFMTPLRKKQKQYRWLDRLGIWHYLLTFRKDGSWRMNRKVRIDYEAMAAHLLALDDAARTRGMYLRKVIFKVELQGPIFKTTAGKKLKRRGVYFVRKLSRTIDNLHDDHYHVDFAFR